MSAADTTMLYVLSTMAQTCAALAAFLGVVGIYKLQALDNEQARHESTVRWLAEPIVGGQVPARNMPMETLIDRFNTSIASVPVTPTGVAMPFSEDTVTRLRDAVATWGDFPGRRRRMICWLWVFEGWNLLLIGAALVGFNHVTVLAASPWALPALWPIAGLTAAITFVCVIAWTNQVRS